ncbi:hypothetical protein, partial [Candidatus Igneacidithiobacillus taiwanensis]|uniref:hypothetical protein n=1 Tax=Candidatus Igneacidithiobacillus taiwanensis TaxID=1945924 RepID=UPI0028991ED5
MAIIDLWAPGIGLESAGQLRLRGLQCALPPIEILHRLGLRVEVLYASTTFGTVVDVGGGRIAVVSVRVDGVAVRR